MPPRYIVNSLLCPYNTQAFYLNSAAYLLNCFLMYMYFDVLGSGCHCKLKDRGFYYFVFSIMTAFPETIP